MIDDYDRADADRITRHQRAAGLYNAHTKYLINIKNIYKKHDTIITQKLNTKNYTTTRRSYVRFLSKQGRE